MSKAEKLQNHLKSADEPKKWKAYVIVAVGVLVGVGLFFGGMAVLNPVLSEYISHKDAPAIYDFYEQNLGENETVVFAVGSSTIGRAFYAPTINQILHDKGVNITAYNGYYSSDSPLERSLEIQKIIDAKPSLIIYGLTYDSITTPVELPRFSERTKLVFDRLNVRDDALPLFTDEEKELIKTPPDIIYYRTFLRSAISSKLLPNENAWTLDHMTDPYGVKARISMDKDKLSETEVQKAVNDLYVSGGVDISDEMNRYKSALIYNVQTLVNAGIPVIILNMPIHPELSKVVSDESRTNYFSLLNQTGVTWYDYENYFNGDAFVDIHHVTFDSAKSFSSVFADLIIQELT